MISLTRSRNAKVGPKRTETLNASAGTRALCVPFKLEDRFVPAEDATIKAEAVVAERFPSVDKPGTAALIAELRDASCA